MKHINKRFYIKNIFQNQLASSKWHTTISCFLLVIYAVTSISSCKQNKDTNKPQKTPHIVVSIAPLELIIKEIVAEHFEITTLIPAGTSPHTYEPVPSVIQTLQKAAIVFYVSEGFDGWVEDFTGDAEILKVKLDSLFTTKEHLHSAEKHSHEHINTPQAHKQAFVDPHFWTSPSTVASIVNDICSKICQIDKNNAEFYQKKAQNFIKKLDSLHNYISNKTEDIKYKPIFTAHNSFAYFIDEFKLTFGGAIEESPGKEITSKYMSHIITNIKNSKVNCIFSEPQLNTDLINMIAKETNVDIVTLDPLNSNNNKTYVDFIVNNAEKICQCVRARP